MHMQSLDDSDSSQERVTPNLSQHRVTPCFKKPVSNHASPVVKSTDRSPEVRCLGERSVFDRANEMRRESEAKSNSVMNMSQANLTPTCRCDTSPVNHEPSNDSLRDQNKSSGLGCRKHALLLEGSFLTMVLEELYSQLVRLHATNSIERVDLLSVIMRLRIMKLYASWLTQNGKSIENAVDIGGVHCTFKSLGESMKPGGIVNNFVIAVFCRHLFMKPNGHPEISKKHFFLAMSENLLKHPDDANFGLLERVSSVLGKPDLFRIQICYDDYQIHVRETLIPSFMFHWDKIVEDKRDMRFDEYQVVYPPVPRQGKDNLEDGGIFLMMFLQNWHSPRTVLTPLFSMNDVNNIRIKITNELMFLPNNNGMKRLVLEFDNEQ
ncbi:hypothetical protein ACP4OV_030422 [Aristida adscensionis]